MFTTVHASPLSSSKPWTIDAMLQVKEMEEVHVSPNGQHVFYKVTHALIDNYVSDYLKSLYVSDTQGQSFALNNEKSCSAPQWSPDSNQIAFLMADDRGVQQIWLWDIQQNTKQQITHFKTSITSLKWSPSGKKIAFTVRDASAEEEYAKQAKDDAYVVDENLKVNRLWTLELNGHHTQPQLLTQGVESVTMLTPFIGGGGYDWSPDEKTILCSLSPSAKITGWRQCYLAKIDLETGETRPFIQTGAGEFHPIYSPDGKWVAFIASEGSPKWPLHFRVYVADANGQHMRALAVTPDEWPVRLLGWSPDSQLIYVTESRRTYKAITVVPFNGKPTYDFTPPHTNFIEAHLNSTGTHFGLSLESSQMPAEAFVTSTQQFEPIRMSIVNQHVKEFITPFTEVIQWTSTDGLTIEGLLTYPTDYQAGQSVPLVLIIHGGPLSASRQDFIGNHNTPYGPIAALAAQGFAVLRCNFRGSTGYGKKFRHANVQDWGGMDYQDILAGVDHVVKMGVADPDRLVASGWSYGGHMMAWLLARTDRFKAIIAGAGVYNCASKAPNCDIPEFYNDYLGITQFPAWDIYHRFSPLFYLKKVSTPTLIEHGEQDKRVPIGQSYELYETLKNLSCPVKMVVYPRTAHIPNEPKLIRDLLHRHIEFFQEHIPQPSLVDSG